MRATVFVSTAVLAAIAAPAFAQTYVYNNIFVPGNVSSPGNPAFSQIFAINATGEALVNASNGTFLYNAASGFTPEALPTGGYTLQTGFSSGASGLNDAGTIVGSASNQSGSTNNVGFIETGGTFTYFSYPGATVTVGRSISSTGLITGYDNVTGGFLYNPVNGMFTAIYPPNSINPVNPTPTRATFTPAQGINASGEIVGSTILQSNAATGAFSAYVDNGGSYTVFQVDGDSTQARGINNAGVITGFIQTSGGAYEGFVGTIAGGFKILNDANGVNGTFAEAINSSGQIGGSYYDGNGNPQGFIATPAYAASSSHNGGYGFNLAVSSSTLIYLGPLVATNYQYDIGSGNPNFASVVLPIGIDTSNSYTLTTCGGAALGTIAGGQTFSFGTGGVSCFDVKGISGVITQDQNTFITGLTFTGSGDFTGSVDPIVTSSAPEPATLGLLGLGFAGVGALRRRRRSA